MAIANVGTRGTQVSAASGTTVARAPSATVAVGRVLFCWVAQNGNQSTTVTDAVGNTWEFIGSGSNSAGNARSDLWLCNVTNQLTTANTITVTFGGAVVHKSMALWEYSVGTGNTLIESTTNIPNQSTGNGFGSVAFSSLPSIQRLYFRALAKQANSTGTITSANSFTSHGLAIRSQNNASAIAQRGEYKIATSTGETSNPTWAVSGNTGNVFAAFEEFTPPPAQNLTQNTRFDNTNTFYTATVTAGPVTLTPARFDNEQTFFAPTVSQSGGAQNLQPGLFTNTQTFYSPTVTRGPVTLQPGLLANTNTFFSPTVTRGAVTLAPARLDNANTFFAPTVSRGAVTLQPSRLDNANQFFAPLVSAGAAILTPQRFDNANTFFGPTVTSRVTLQPARFDNTNEFYSPTVGIQSGQQLQPELFVNTNQFFGAQINLNITFPDWVEPGWVEPGWVGWPYFNTNQFFSATVQRGPVSELGIRLPLVKQQPASEPVYLPPQHTVYRLHIQ